MNLVAMSSPLWLLLLSAILMLTATIDQAAALKCWRCSSDASNADFCRDPFDESAVTAEQRRFNYVECAAPPQQPYGVSKVQRSVCKKIHQTVNGKSVITRSCLWEDVDAPADHCQAAGQQLPSYVQIVMCRTCATDGCNGQRDFAVLPQDPQEPSVKTSDAANNEVAPSSGAPALMTGLMWKGGSLVSMLVLTVAFLHVSTQLCR